MSSSAVALAGQEAGVASSGNLTSTAPSASNSTVSAVAHAADDDDDVHGDADDVDNRAPIEVR
jgi:hypothetical protein